jgi:arylsulfatase A-like enzyme
MNGTPAQPNVILVLTDDQGYGDLGCTGNPWIRTPHIDRFHDEAVRLTDFHVSPLCTPTRGAIMTGRRPVRNGAWATCWGRSILRKSEVTMADVFAGNGYRTALFGKWHLGDNYPYRPQDRGFQHVVAHRGGGVGQTPDFWGNNYFDDSYWHNGELVPHKGYCTDIWFEEAMQFIEAHREEPFFAYIATNAPHSPYLVADRYKDPYENNPDIPEPAFYGMIANIDENFGALEAKLKELGIAENTILIFMTDNGSSAGARLGDNGLASRGYNAGMRGMKGSYYDGGHRVPFFLRWPGGRLQGGRDVKTMALHHDLLPTLIELCGLRHPDGVAFDGASFAGCLAGEGGVGPERTQILQIRQSTEPPEQWTNAVMTQRWRLLHGKELYDIAADPGQQNDVAHRYPDVVARLRAEHEAWWAEIEPALHQTCHISLGNDAENPTRLDAMDVLGDVAWHQSMIVNARKSTGRWNVDVERPGTYSISLRRWPEELGLPIDAAVSAQDANSLIYAAGDGSCQTIAPVRARIKLFDREWTQPVKHGMEAVSFVIEVEQTGETQLEAWFRDPTGDECGAYYVYVERI